MRKGEFITFAEHVKSISDSHRSKVESWLREQKSHEILREHGGAEFRHIDYDDFGLYSSFPPVPTIPHAPRCDDVGPFSKVTLIRWEGPNHTPQFIECRMIVVSVSGDLIEGYVFSDYAHPRGRMTAAKDNVIEFHEILRADQSAADYHEMPETWQDELP